MAQLTGWVIAITEAVCCSVSFVSSEGWVPLRIHSIDPAWFQTHISKWLPDDSDWMFQAFQTQYWQSWAHYLSLHLDFLLCFLSKQLKTLPMQLPWFLFLPCPSSFSFYWSLSYSIESTSYIFLMLIQPAFPIHLFRPSPSSL